MLAPLLSFASVVLFVSGTAASSVGSVYSTPSTNDKTSTTLGNGKSFQAGYINSNIAWQASGTLLAGGCVKPGGVLPKSCYQISLTAAGELEAGGTTARSVIDLLGGGSGTRRQWSASHGNLTYSEKAIMDDLALNDYFQAFPEQAKSRYEADVSKSSSSKREVIALSPRATAGKQRIEIFSWPGAAAKETWKYTWESYLSSSTTTSKQFFHSWQILRRDSTGGPVVALDWKAGDAVISDTVLGCASCFKTSIKPFLGATVYHSVTVTYGPQGSIDYVCTSTSGAVLIEYHSKGRDMGSSASIKMGSYRAVVSSAAATSADIADFVGTRLA